MILKAVILWTTYHIKAKDGYFLDEIAVINLFKRNYARDILYYSQSR